MKFNPDILVVVVDISFSIVLLAYIFSIHLLKWNPSLNRLWKRSTLKAIWKRNTLKLQKWFSITVLSPSEPSSSQEKIQNKWIIKDNWSFYAHQFPGTIWPKCTYRSRQIPFWPLDHLNDLDRLQRPVLSSSSFNLVKLWYGGGGFQWRVASSICHIFGPKWQWQGPQKAFKQKWPFRSSSLETNASSILQGMVY